ncbi:hypothetical protein Atep_30980 (plasmid) [Allochromatium tepidum]|uniref:HTH iclR-type domain-containing protein n=1 Tax=Allochromatium tepidum TaxID=553982 RepID=A0ABN6GEP4_9GAMM|nr:hypothetical protein Atep_30980 [Allochromatium tepidum]
MLESQKNSKKNHVAIERRLLEQAGNTEIFRRVNVAQVAREIGTTHAIANRVLHSLVEHGVLERSALRPNWFRRNPHRCGCDHQGANTEQGASASCS